MWPFKKRNRVTLQEIIDGLLSTWEETSSSASATGTKELTATFTARVNDVIAQDIIAQNLSIPLAYEDVKVVMEKIDSGKNGEIKVYVSIKNKNI